ncbi:MAG: hypothetical protein AB7O59_22495 [Pirellulales bacterium]
MHLGLATRALCGLLVLLACGGAGCPRVVQQYVQPIPRALPPSPSLDQIVNIVNDNSARINSLSAPAATITMAGYPALSANINFMRPRSLRLVAHKFIGPELDVGSNDELMWFWVRRAQPPALYFCSHSQFGTSAARQVLPVDPEWLIEALGLITFDRSGQIEGPFPVGSGRVEIRTRNNTSTGTVSRIVIIDDSRGIVLEDHIYDGQGVRLATARLSGHKHDPATGAKLPRHVDIQWPPAGMEIALELGDVTINQLSATPQELFTKPVYQGFSEVDLAQPGGLVPVSPPSAAAATQFRAPPSTRYQ